MDEEKDIPEFEKKELYPEKEKETILVSIEKYEAMVLLIEALFNILNDRFSLGNVGNELLSKIEKLKKEINDAKD